MDATTPKKHPVGRPRIDPSDESIPVSFRLPAKQYDAMWRKALHARETVPEFVRRVLRDATNDTPSRHRER